MDVILYYHYNFSQKDSLLFFILRETNIAVQAQSQNNHMLINREQNSNLDFFPKWEKFQQTRVGKEHVKNYKWEVLAKCSVMCYNVKYIRYYHKFSVEAICQCQ